MDDENIFVGVKAAAKYLGVHFSDVYRKIREGRLKPSRKNFPRAVLVKYSLYKYIFTKNELDNFLLKKKDRRKMKADENKIYDKDRDRWAPTQIAELLSEISGRPFPSWRILYWIRAERLKAKKSGRFWVIKKEDALACYNSEKQNLMKRK